MHYWKNTWWFNYNVICNLQMQEPQLNCLPAAGASGLCFHISFMLWKGSLLALCFEAVKNPETVSTDLPVQGLLLLPWIPWRQETVGCVVQICSAAFQPSSSFSSQKQPDLCWMYLASCRRVGSYTTKTLSFVIVTISVRRSVFTSIIRCAAVVCITAVSCCCFLL